MTTELQNKTACCDAENHESHLCYIQSQGFHLSERDAYEAMVDDPKWRCGHCRRTANDRGFVCVPVEL